MPLSYGPGDEAKAAIDKMRAYAEAAGRDPADIGIDTRVTAGIGYYSDLRTHLALAKDAPISRPIQRFGQITARPISAAFVMNTAGHNFW